jgi:general secretion pathway protein A
VNTADLSVSKPDVPAEELAVPTQPAQDAPSAPSVHGAKDSSGGGALYAAYFGLVRDPFSIAPDPRFLYMSERHREALALLLYGVRGGGGVVLLTGEIGAGKTTVCRCFLEQIPQDVNVAYVLNPRQTVQEILETICEEFHIELVSRRQRLGLKEAVDALNQFLLQSHAEGRSNVLIIDEAQNLSSDVLEQLRLLTNLETADRKLLQIILIGQPELVTMLESPRLEQLNQRVIARYHLQTLSTPETANYVRHRLTVSGIGAAQPFDSSALRLIDTISRGVPRRINLLCDRALLGAYAKGRSRVSISILEQAAQEVFGKPAPSAQRRQTLSQRRRFWTLVAYGLLMGLSISALAGWWLVRAGWVSLRPVGPVLAEGEVARSPAHLLPSLSPSAESQAVKPIGTSR